MIGAFIVCAALFVGGCADVDTASDLDVRTAALSAWDGTADGVGVLALLNDSTTTLDTLDIDARLDRRAAGNLIAHRNGGDGIFGSSDDDLYNSVAEVDAVRWVGNSAIERLADYAATLGHVPGLYDVLGTYDNVTFTVEEAALTIAIVNQADFRTLDETYGLNSRAAASIIEAQPVSTVQQLAGLYYVGRKALDTLRTEAITALGGESFTANSCQSDCN